MPRNLRQDSAEAMEATVDDQTVMALQSDSAHSRSRRHTLKLLAQIGKKQVLILVDSGSIGTFVSDHLVQSLQLPTTTCDTFRIADGNLMTCNTMVPDLSWFIQGHTLSMLRLEFSLSDVMMSYWEKIGWSR